ncbi:MAG: hypothetical protein JKY27_07115, partial [Magnetovibrio sp.]|nr:hypothetical protein [Magnetovibrio sp.]
MRRILFRIAMMTAIGVGLSACAPAHQYQALSLTTLELGQSRSVEVLGIGRWRDTGIEMRRDEVYRVATRGTWAAGPFCGDVDASGLPTEHLLCMKAIFAQAFPIPQAKIMALVGKIGPDGTPFVIGATIGFIADRDGTLYLRSNDPNDFLWDNTGQINVAVQRYGEGVGTVSFDATANSTTTAAPATGPTARTSRTSR